jgi:hypothetical protein
MKAGRRALPSARVTAPASRNSLTSRSCKVLCARSTRPLAWLELAQMMSMLKACSARPNVQKTLFASEQDRPAVARRREQWRKYQDRVDPRRLVLIDETWAKTNMAPLLRRSHLETNWRTPQRVLASRMCQLPQKFRLCFNLTETNSRAAQDAAARARRAQSRMAFGLDEPARGGGPRPPARTASGAASPNSRPLRLHPSAHIARVTQGSPKLSVELKQRPYDPARHSRTSCGGSSAMTLKPSLV